MNIFQAALSSEIDNMKRKAKEKLFLPLLTALLYILLRGYQNSQWTGSLQRHEAPYHTNWILFCSSCSYRKKARGGTLALWHSVVAQHRASRYSQLLCTVVQTTTSHATSPSEEIRYCQSHTPTIFKLCKHRIIQQGHSASMGQMMPVKKKQEILNASLIDPATG